MSDVFGLGVASFDPTETGVLLRTHVVGGGPLRWDLALEEGFTTVVASGAATADPGSGTGARLGPVLVDAPARVRWVDVDHRGYLTVDLSPRRCEATWWWVDPDAAGSVRPVQPRRWLVPRDLPGGLVDPEVGEGRRPRRRRALLGAAGMVVALLAGRRHRGRAASSLVMALGLVVALGTAGCSEGGSGAGSATGGAPGGDSASAGPGSTAGVPATLPAQPSSAAGSGTIRLGASTAEFSVTACVPTPDESQPEAARTLFALDGAGSTPAGVAFTVSVRRFRTGREVATFTDTVSYADGARILQAQRIEVAGQSTDLRDPRAAGSLLRLRPAGVSASGVAGPPGSGAGEEGLVALSLDASC